MKNLKTTFLFLCICFLNCYAQDHVLYDGIQQSKGSGEEFEPVFALTLSRKSASQNKEIGEYFFNPQEVYMLRYDKSAAKNLNASMTLNIPLGNRNLQLELQEFRMEYQVTTSDNQKISQNKNIRHYQGIVKDDPHSVVAITFGEDEIIGLVATDEGNFNLAMDRLSGNHIFYNDKNVKQKPEFICGTQADDELEGYSAEVLLQSTRAYVTQKCVRLYFETEFDVFQTLGSVPNVETFMTGLYNQVALLYYNEGIKTSLSQIHIWNTTDPFTSATPLGLLTQFQNTRTSFNGDLGQLVTFRNIGGGRADGFDGLCNNNVDRRLSVTMLYDNYKIVPNYSWSVFAVTHELGHLFGSPHTHACFWNGNNTAIDGCAGYTEDPVTETIGGCLVPAIPSNGGTIMSYCHQQSEGINFNLGFGLQPGNVIRNSVINANCIPYINGPSTICGPDTFFLIDGQATSWSLPPNSGFTIASFSATSATVMATSFNGQITTLTAVVNGVNITTSFNSCQPYVTGPDFLCWQTSATYTLQNAPAGLPIMWMGSGLQPENSSPGTSKLFTATTTTGGFAVAVIIDNNTQTQIAKQVKGDKVQSIVGPSTIPYGGYGQYGANMTCPGLPNLTWTLEMEHFPDFHQITTQNNPINVYFNMQGGYSSTPTKWFLKVDGVTKEITTYGKLSFTQGRGGDSPFTAYPNPVSDILYVVIDREAIATEQITDDKVSKPENPTYNVRLYDTQGNLLRQRKTKGRTVEFNVANLIDGVYYLHIYDGVSENPEMIPIVVEH